MKTDFLIIGAGVIGLTTAQALLKNGYRVTLMERGEIGQEASWAGGGILSPLSPWDYKEPVTRLAQRGMDMFGASAAKLLAATGIDPEYQRSGMLLFPPYREELASQWCAQHQFALQSVDLADYFSGEMNLRETRPGELNSGLLLPEVAQVRNPRLLRALRRDVELLGGVLLEHHEVQKFEISNNRVTGLQTTRGRFVASEFIITAGAWSKALLGEHALNMDIRPIRGQILLFKFDDPPFRQILLKQDLYLIPRRDGHVLVGSTLEDVGFDKSTTVEARDSMSRRIQELFPEWHDRLPVKHWAGFRPGSPDNIPTIGRHPIIKNLYANCGHFRYGVTMSFVSAELLLNEIEGKPQLLPMKEYLWQ